MNVDALDLSILGPAFATGLLVLATHVPLGREVLSRGIIFIDLAIAQIAGLGVLMAYSLDWEDQPRLVQTIAFSTAMAGALLLHYCERRWPDVQEALIGISFILAATASILLLSNNAHGGEHLKELLVGQILWVNYASLLPVSSLYAVILALWFVAARTTRSLLFYLLFAITVTASVQLVGIYLVFASLIIPALATRQRSGPGALIMGYFIGIIAYALGLSISAVLDLPAGAVIVWSLAVVALFSSVVFRGKLHGSTV